VFSKHFTENLAKIIEATGAMIVVSSTWRSRGTIAIKDMWEFRNLPGDVIGCTGYDVDRHRGNEIQNWLNEVNSYTEIESYVILDDDSDFLLCQRKHHVKTAGNNHLDAVEGFGLTTLCTEKAINILNNKF